MENAGWDESLDTGHAGMDVDHKELTELFQQLRDAIETSAGKASCTKALDNIIGHTRAHFELEQRLMTQYRYPKTEQHAAEHAMLIQQALDFRASFDVTLDASNSALMHFADVWLAFHILFSDKDLAAFLAHTRIKPGAQ